MTQEPEQANQPMYPWITSLPEFLAHAHAIEVDAYERYILLADSMDVANNKELAGLFRKLASHEQKHADEILKRAGDIVLPQIRLADQTWADGESPEAASLEQAHYLMTPWHALQMALQAEQRAFDFFDHLCNNVADDEMKKWAEEFREEEAEHVRLVEELLVRYPKPEDGWDHDDDPPMYQE